MKTSISPTTPLSISTGELFLSKHFNLNDKEMLQIDTTFPFSWNGQHTFLSSINFSRNQVVPTFMLSAENEKHGDILCFQREKGWMNLSGGTAGRVMVWIGGFPTWGFIDLNTMVSGVLPSSRGGTGTNSWQKCEIPVGSSTGNLVKLVPQIPGEVLTFDGENILWQKPQILSGNGEDNTFSLWKKGTLCSSPVKLTDTGVVFDVPIQIGEHLKISFNNSDPTKIIIGSDQGTLIISQNGIAFKNKLIFDGNGTMITGTVPFERMIGVVASENGGTGISQIRKGDILMSPSGKLWSTLSTINAQDGDVISLVDGLPAWSTPNNAVENPKTTIRLAAGNANRAPIMFRKGALSTNLIDGAIERDPEGYLYFTQGSSTRQRFLMSGDNIDGSSKMVREIVPVELGGLGVDTSKFPDRSLIIKDNGVFRPFVANNIDTALVNIWNSEMNCMTLSWQSVLRNILVRQNGGISSDGNSTTPRLSLDFAVNADWSASHRFRALVQMDEGVYLGGILFRPLINPPEPKQGLVWFDGKTLWLFANGRPQPLGGNTESKTQSHYLSLVKNTSLFGSEMYRQRIPLPYASDGITPRQWRIRKIVFRGDEMENYANINVRIGQNYLFENPVMVNNETKEFTEFIHTVSNSGEEVVVECPYAISGYLSAWMQIEA